MKRLFVLSKLKLYVLTILFAITSASYSSARTLTIRVNASKSLGPVPDILSSSIWIASLEKSPEFVLKKFFKENNPATVMLTVSFVLKLSKDFEDYKRRLKDLFSTNAGYTLIQGIIEKNSTLIIGFDPAPMPSWLSSRPGNKKKAYIGQPFYIEELSPPKDYELWGKVIGHTLRFLRETKGVKKIGVYIGHEPNWMWLGSQESFLKYYGSAAIAAKRVSHDIKVGGIGTFAVETQKLDCNDKWFSKASRNLCRKEGGWADGTPMIKTFIEYVAKKNLPLDFVNWHEFQGTPIDYANVVKEIRSWLSQSGLKNVKLYPADWTYWRLGKNGYPVDYLDGEEMASYAMNTIFHMWKLGIEWHGHDFFVREEWTEEKRSKERKNSTFIGDWSMVTRAGVVKPIYNAFRALSLATGKNEKGKMSLLETKFSEDMITAISTMNTEKDKIHLLITNFLPSSPEKLPELRESQIAQIMTNRISFTSHDIRSHFTSEEISLAKDKKSLQTLILKEKNPRKRKILVFYRDLDRAAKCIRNMKEGNNEMFLNCANELPSVLESKAVIEIIEALKTKLEPLPLQIEFQNLPFSGRIKLTTYTIDKNHSNACSFNKSTEPKNSKTPCGIGGVVDKTIWNIRRNVEKTLRKVGKTEMEESQKQRAMKAIETAFTEIEKINEWKDVSLKGSEQVAIHNLTKNQHTINLMVEPNSVWLIVLSKVKK